MSYDATIIIPVYNQLNRLKFTLEGFLSQKNYKKLQIIVVDDGSDEPVSEYIKSLKRGNIICIVNLENKGRAYARNLGASYASSEFLIFCDADRIPCPNYVQEHLKVLENGVVSVGVLKEIYFSNLEDNKKKIFDIVENDGKFSRETQYSRMINILFDNSKSNSPISWICATSANLGISKEDFIRSGGFDEKFVGWGFEHFELGYRLLQNKVNFVRVLGAKNYHMAHSREKNFYVDSIHQSFEYFYKKHHYTDVKYLKNFHEGKISLEEYNDLVEGSTRLQDMYKDHMHYLKIFNL